MGEIPWIMVINQSLIKAILNKLQVKDYCPYFIQQKYLLKKDVGISTEAQMKGRYFEYLLFGGKNPQPQMYKRGGAEKKIDYLRIEEQVEIARSLYPQHLITVFPEYNTGVRLKKAFNGHIIEGILDLFPTLFMIEEHVRIAIIDLKLTKNIHNDFGEFGWGNFEQMDWIQPAMYHELVRDINWDINPHISKTTRDLIERFTWQIDNDEIHFFFWVFDIKDPLENEMFEVTWDYDKKLYLERAVEKAVIELEHMKENDYPQEPGNHCFNCTIDCELRQTIKTR